MTEPIKVLIIDDEPLARSYIRQLLSKESDFTVVGEAGSGRVGLRQVAKLKPELLFLDVQMPGMDGFELFGRIEPERMPFVIFSTAFEEHAIRAFEVHAIDYLLKPFDRERFQNALCHAREILLKPEAKQRDAERMFDLLQTIGAPRRYLERLLIKRKGKIVFVKIDDIHWIHADDKYLHLEGTGQKHLVRQTLGGLSSQLDPSRFFQINRSVIVNLEFVRELRSMFNGDFEIVMSDGKSFPLTRSFRHDLFEKLGKPVC